MESEKINTLGNIRAGIASMSSKSFPAAFFWVLLIFAWTTAKPAEAKYASLVMDAKTGLVLHAVNAHTLNSPASLTKLMTL